MKINLEINGKEYSPGISRDDMTLLRYLRDRLLFTGAKNGCGEGHCGACTVIIDGKAKLSCLVKMKTLEGCRVETPEALSTGGSVHAIVYSYVAEGAVQCGFCTPGCIMSTKALLDRVPDPSVQEIQKALTRNICRCTGYTKIVKAVQRASSLILEGRVWIEREKIFPETVRPVGVSVPRVDAVAKATGELRFADDLFFPDMLYAKVLRSEYPHAEITGIDVSRARKTKGVAAVLTAGDIPGRNAFGPITADQPVFADKKVRYLGDAIAAVYAETESAAEEALSKISVEYAPLPVVSTEENALKEGAVLLHGTERTGNIFSHMESGRGDTVQGFSEADIVLEGEYTTQYVEHGYLEPESGVGVPGENGRITIYVGSQGPEADIKEIAPVLGVPAEKIHIAHMPVGGAFGGKEDVSVQIIIALGVMKTGRPVKYTFTRRESIRTSGKINSQRLRYKTGVTRDGKITAVKAEILARAGAYASVEEAVILRSVSFAAGPYMVPHGEIKADAYYCNNMPTCAMRGFGNPPVTFAAETQMNRLAALLGMDPFEIRLVNALEEGLPSITGERIPYSVGIKKCLNAVRDSLQKEEIPAPRKGWKTGVGIAASYKNVGFGIGMNDSAGAFGKIIKGGKLLLRVGSVDMGQGADTAMAQIVSEEVGWPYSMIVVESADTDRDPRAGMTTASRQTFVSGNAVYEMSKRLKRKLYAFIGKEFHMPVEDICIHGSCVRSLKRDAVILSLPELSRLLVSRGIDMSEEFRYFAPHTSFSLKEPVGGYPKGEGRLHVAYCFAVQAVILEVNPDSGKVVVLKVIAASDTGRPVNPQAVEGQIEGGIAMGLGYGLSEEFRIENGYIQSDSYGKLGLRRIGQTPEIESIIVENPHPEGPYGAKGMSELTISLGAPAVVHALYNALGVWITSLPATPEKVRRALAENR